METTLLPQPTAPPLPADAVGMVGILGAATAGSDTAFPSFVPGSHGPANLSAPGGEAVALALPIAPRRLGVEPGPYLADALENRWQSYRKQLKHCQKEFSEEAVHELRVATRRLLAQFVLLSNVAPSAALEKARRSLKRRLVDLGDLRDTQVQRKFVEQHGERYAGTDPLRRWLERRERRLIKAAVRRVRGARTRKLEKRLAAMAEGLIGDQRRSRAQQRLAAAAFHATAQAYADAVKRRRAINISDLRTVHQTRIAFKRFRYMVESLSPGLTGLSRRQLRTLAYYQRRMGIIQDLEVIQRCVREFAREQKGAEVRLRPFCRYLSRRRARALQSFLKNADGIFGFWPPARISRGGER